MKRIALTVPLVACLAMMCGGCSLFADKLAAAPPLKVKITAECARLGKPVAEPSIAENDDAFNTTAEYRAALVTANRKIVARDTCEARVRHGYGAGQLDAMSNGTQGLTLLVGELRGELKHHIAAAERDRDQRESDREESAEYRKEIRHLLAQSVDASHRDRAAVKAGSMRSSRMSRTTKRSASRSVLLC